MKIEFALHLISLATSDDAQICVQKDTACHPLLKRSKTLLTAVNGMQNKERGAIHKTRLQQAKCELLKMSSAWRPPNSKEGYPSVLSDRVYSIRRLNKMESQRLHSQLNYLNAEIAQSKSLISQEQTALRKELEQIRKVKDNPSIGLEKRKLLRKNFSSRSQTFRHGLSLETQAMQSRFRSLSTGQAPKRSSQLTPLSIRRRSKSTTCPPLRVGVDELSGLFYAMNSVEDNDQGNGRCQKKPSFSTGTQPQISELETDANAKTNGITDTEGADSEVLTDTKTMKWERSNRLENTKKYDLERGGPQLISIDFRQKLHERGSNAPGKLVPTRRVRSFSTSSTPIISEGKVVGLSGKTTTVPLQSVDAARQRSRCWNTSCISKTIEERRLGVLFDSPVMKTELRQSTPIPVNRRPRSLSTNDFNDFPVTLERRGTTQNNNCLEPNLKKEPFKSNEGNLPSFENKEKTISKEQVQNGAALPETTNGHNNTLSSLHPL